MQFQAKYPMFNKSFCLYLSFTTCFRENVGFFWCPFHAEFGTVLNISPTNKIVQDTCRNIHSKFQNYIWKDTSNKF